MQSLADTVRRLESNALLKGLDSRFLRLLAGYSSETVFNPGQLIFMEGEPATCFYLILQGEVVLEANRSPGKRLTFEHLGAGEFLGWSWLIPPYRWHFSARAVEPTKAFYFHGASLRKLCWEDPAFAFEMTSRMAAVLVRRLEQTQRYIRRPVLLRPEFHAPTTSAASATAPSPTGAPTSTNEFRPPM